MTEVKGNTIYTGNQVNDALVFTTKQALDCFDDVEVCFDVIGRTRHQCLAHELHAKLGGDAVVEATITYNYGCVFKKRR